MEADMNIPIERSESTSRPASHDHDGLTVVSR